METRMNRLTRLAVGGAVAAAGLLAAAPARAQMACNDASLPNPIIISGSTAFEATIRLFAAKLNAEPLPNQATIIYTQAMSLQGSCNGVADIVNDTDLGNTQGRYYGGPAGATNNVCTFAAGQKAHLAISDVYYESCTN